MILAVDVGNTETVLGLFRGLEPTRCWRIATDRHRTGDELALLLRGLLRSEERDSAARVERAALASVVPVMDRVWATALEQLEVDHVRVTAETDLPVDLDVEEPGSVGADRIANTLASHELYGRNTVVVDLGTATTYDCISAEGTFLGGVIAPGPRAGMERLSQTASKLPQGELEPPDRVIGRRTRTCLDSGIFYSVVDAIDGIVERILAEWEPDRPLVVGTGGLVDLIAPRCRTIDHVEPYLTLIGLAAAEEHTRAAIPREEAAG